MNSTEKVIELLLADILSFHDYLEQFFVMSPGIHDHGLLESAVSVPFQSYAGVPLYSSIYEKAARLCYGLAKNHPFIDGNKRIAIHSMLVFLSINQVDIHYTDDEMENIVIDIVTNKMSCEELSEWLQMRARHINE